MDKVLVIALSLLSVKHMVWKVSWTDNVSTVYNALESGKGVIFHTGPNNKYHFTKKDIMSSYMVPKKKME